MPSMGPASESTHLDASGWDPALNRGVGTQADPSVMDALAYSEMLYVYAILRAKVPPPAALAPQTI
jgi:hypothetical protein